jgi:hypothetical protein
VLKEQFRRELRSRLSQVPLETRRGWTDVELRVWWLGEQRADLQLTTEVVVGACRSVAVREGDLSGLVR